MKTMLFIFLFLTGSIVPNLIFAQYLQQGPKLVGTGSVGSVLQGTSVAISSDGNTMIVGGPSDNLGIGAVWIFTRSGGVWTQQGPKLVGIGAIGIAQQGISVAISSDGNTAIVGGHRDNNFTGAVWVFTRSGGVWTQQGNSLVGTGAIGFARQGISVAISSDGNTAIVGGSEDNIYTGAVWVFTRSGGIWTQQGPKLVGTGAVGISRQGISVDVSSDGNTAIVGGYSDNANSGAVWVFTRSGSVWSQQGLKLVGTGAVGNSRQGYSVAISSDGDTFIGGGYVDNANTGAAWVFTRSSGVWTQQGSKLVGSNATGNGQQGYSVDVSSDGNLVIIGGSADNTGTGAVWVFTRSISVWSQLGPKLVGTGAIGSALQGRSVAISSDGGTLIEGGYVDNANTGAVWVFVNQATDVKDEGMIINNFSLQQNYPNPFNPSTKIRFQLAEVGFTSLKVFDVLGKEVATLVNEEKPTGNYEIEFDATGLSSGIYFYKLQSNSFVKTNKMILIK